MENLTIDIECRSDKDLTKCGVYAYVDSPYFEITLFSYSVDDGKVQTVDLANDEKIPEEILNALVDENTVKQAFNVNFERVCLSIYLRKNYPKMFRKFCTENGFLNPVSWHCTMIHCRYLSLPSSLEEAGKILHIEQQKMTEGKNLIKFFCVPFATENDIPQFHQPEEYPEKWTIFKSYNQRDVEAEMAIDRKLSRFPVPEFLWQEFYLDQRINDRGIEIDREFVESALALDAQAKAKLTAEMRKLTGVENPNSVYQLLDWLASQGCPADSLAKENVMKLLSIAEEPVKSVLEIRQQLAKSSVKKYQAMQTAVCFDSRARGMFSFYGASRSGRFSGKIIQLQNLPQNHIPDLTEARETVKYGDYDEVEMLYDDVPDTLSQLIRTAFIPKKGCKFIVADFSAIEARVIAWLAGETWRMQAFAKGEDIYCASASKMFGVPVVKHGINGHLRQKGKIAELACIAEGQLVLTNHWLVPIEKVTTADMLWDGENWVHHEGVIYKGEREVITYEGLTATPDHLVFSENHFTEFEKIAGNGAINGGVQKVYDIRNVGQNHCFTVSGKLVHNCGYGGSVGAMKAMGGEDLHLSDAELKQIVTDWRNASPHIVQLWYDVENAAMRAISGKMHVETHGLEFCYESGFLFIKLPSGRRLAYVQPKIGVNRFGGKSLTYMGLNMAKKWERIETFSGKLTENITQAIARDLLLNSMKTLSDYRIVAHVHDELIIECDKSVTVQEICAKMAEVPDWAKGLKLRADGYECEFYRKD